MLAGVEIEALFSAVEFVHLPFGAFDIQEPNHKGTHKEQMV